MAMLSFGGIDVSKDRLDITVLPDEQCSSVSNDAAGWAELIEQLRGSSITAIGVEASGGYERGVVRALLAAGMSVRQINPFKLRQFAKASGLLAKNDRLDARMIASFVAIMPTGPAQQQPAPTITGLSISPGHKQDTSAGTFLQRFEMAEIFCAGPASRSSPIAACAAKHPPAKHTEHQRPQQQTLL